MLFFLEAAASWWYNTPWFWMKVLVLIMYVWIWMKTSSPLLASGSVLALLKYCLWGMLAKNMEWAPGPECWEAVGKYPTRIPQPIPYSQGPRGRGRGKVLAVQCLWCSSSVLDTLWCVGWRFWFFHIQVEAVNVKHPICVLMRFPCIFNIWNSLIFSNISLCWIPVSPTDC